MCIAVIVVNYSPRFPLIICHNRDEDPNRPTSDLGIRDNILSATDLRSCGIAAVGLNISTGVCAVLTNSRNVATSHPTGSSRGQLLKRVLSEPLTPAGISDLLAKEYQGGFYVYVTNCFLANNVAIDLISNVSPPSHEEFRVPSEPRVFIKMNEHSTSYKDWSRKLDFLGSQMNAFTTNQNEGETLPGLFDALERIMSQTTHPDLSSQESSEYAWSPCPMAESRLLSHVVIPHGEILPGLKFGTVSQTMIVVDKQSNQVHYRYRTVDFPKFSPWDARVIEF